MSESRLEDVIEKIKRICGFDLSIVDSDGQVLVGIEMSDDKCVTLPIISETGTRSDFFLKINSTRPEDEKLREMALLEVGTFLTFIERTSDRHSFAASLIAGDIPSGELYRFAGKLHIKDEARVVYVLELNQVMPDITDVTSLCGIFAEKKSDFFFRADERHLVVIRSIEDDDPMEFALSAIDTIESELMVPARVGYSSSKQTLLELREAYNEACLTLKVMGLFSEKTNAAAYSKLGIARLIYELPMSLCESFLRELFGDKIPMDEMDESELTTISAFYENNLNISETARQLYLHRNTLVYRLERIEKEIGMDIRRFDDAMTFKIAMMVLAHYRQERGT